MVVVLGIAHVAALGGAAHGVLLEALAGWALPGGSTALALTAGLLLSVMAYFWRDLADMAVGLARAAKGKRDPGARLAAQLVAASAPAAAVVLALPALEVGPLAPTPMLIGWVTVGGGALLFLLDRMSMTIKRIEHASFVDMTVVALAQVVAVLVPGVGRAGVTMIFARLLGYERADAAKISLLLAIPALAGFCGLQAHHLAKAGTLAWQPWLLGAAAGAFLAGLTAVAVMMAWLRRRTFAPFALYRVLAGAAVLVLAFGV